MTTPDFSALTAFPVFYRTYSRKKPDGTRESWHDVCDRTIAGLAKLGKLTQDEIDLVTKMQKQVKTLASGRWLWVGGTEWLDKPDNVAGAYNCFAGDTYVYTSEFGIVQMSAIVGKKVTVLNGNYEKSQVTFRSYGVQNIWKLVLSRGGGLEKTYRVTPDHEWILEDLTRVKTKDLRQQKLKSIHGDIWTVKEVIPTEEMAEVFCCEETKTHSFILQSGLLTGNCTSTNIEDIRSFGLLMDLAMQGSGTGAVLQDKFISKLPTVKNKIAVNLLRDIGEVAKSDRKELTEVEIIHDDEFGACEEATIIVGDSRKGWVGAYLALLELATSDRNNSGFVAVNIDLGNVRPAGERLQGFGGVANPIKLTEMFSKIAAVLNRAIGRQLNSVECCLLIDEAAVTVVAGNIRRCIAYGSRVSTSLGIKPIQDIKIGDLVLTSTGEYKPVVNKFDQGVQEVLEVRTRSSSIQCTSNHKIAVYDSTQSYKWKYAKDLEKGDRLISVPHMRGLPTTTTDWAWLIGFFIGDGHADTKSVKKRNGGGGVVTFALSTERLKGKLGEKLLRILRTAGYQPTVSIQENRANVSVYRKELATNLETYKQPWSCPVIPDFIWEGTQEVRASFLAGLSDADGTPSRNVLVNSTKLEFLRETQKLALSLGIATTLHERKPKTLVNRERIYEGCHWIHIQGLQSQAIAVALINQFAIRDSYTLKIAKKNGLSLPYQFIQEIVLSGWKSNTMTNSSNIIRDAKGRKNVFRDANFDTLLAEGVANPIWLPIEVQFIAPVGTSETFDIEIECDHEFVCEGLLVHNSAGMRQFDADDELGATAKDNLWTQDTEGNWSIDPTKDALRMANHTRVFTQKPTEQECIDSVRKQFYSGEGAIQWAGEAIARGNADILTNDQLKKDFIAAYVKGDGSRFLLEHSKKDIDSRELEHRLERLGLNPCLAGDTLILTPEGEIPIKELVGRTVSIWDGINWTEVNNFRITGRNQKMLKITFENGDFVRCTYSHQWLKVDMESTVFLHSKVFASDLMIGDVLSSHNETDFTIAGIAEDGADEQVYCCTVNTTNCFGLANGLMSGNCGEIIGSNLFCNLGEVHLNQLDPSNFREQEDAFKAGAIAVASLLHHKFPEPRYQYSRDIDPIVAVSFTGLFDFFVNAFGVNWLKWWKSGRPENWGDDFVFTPMFETFSQSNSDIMPQSEYFALREREYLNYWKEVVRVTIKEYCQRHSLVQPNRYTALQPSGSKSLLTGASPGWHPPKSQRFIRRITFAKNDPVALACIDYGYSVIPSQSDKDENGTLLNDPFDPRCTEWLVEIPIAVNWSDIPGADQVDISKFSALAQFDFYMQVQRYYISHNGSATIELRENEIEPLGKRIYQAIENDEGYISAALLARFDANETFPRLPFEPIDKATYDRLVSEVASRKTTDDFYEDLLKYDSEKETGAIGPAGCDSDKCLLPEKRKP